MNELGKKIRLAIGSLSVSAAAIGLIANFEGYSDKAYLDQGGVATIGYGETKGVKLGDTVTEAQARQMLHSSASQTANQIKQYIKVPLYQWEFDAYVSFAYNVGAGNFRSSSLLKYLNQGKYGEACAQLKRWVYIKGKYSKGLANRRAMEYAVCTGKYGMNYTIDKNGNIISVEA